MKNQRYILTSGLLLASLAIFGGCSKEDSINSSERYLSFGVNTVDMSITKSAAAEATEPATSVTLKTQGGNVYLPMTVTEEPNCDFAAAGTKAESISDITSFYTKGFDDSGDQWFPASGDPELVTTGKQYSGYRWLDGNDYLFFAYSDLPDYASATIDEEDMTLTLSSIPSDAEAQQDILLGVYGGDGNGEGKAAMNFYHPLSAVIFKLGSTSGTMSITGISIDGVKKGGSTVWSEASESGGLLEFDWSASGSIKVEQQILSPGSDDQLGVPFMLIPQTFTSENLATITVTATVDGVAKEFTASLASGEWVSGMKYTYTLNFASGPDPDFWVDLGMVSDNGYPLLISKYNVKSIDNNGDVTFAENSEDDLFYPATEIPSMNPKVDGLSVRLMSFREGLSMLNDDNFEWTTDKDYSNSTAKSKINGNSVDFPRHSSYGYYALSGAIFYDSSFDYIYLNTGENGEDGLIGYRNRPSGPASYCIKLVYENTSTEKVVCSQSHPLYLIPTSYSTFDRFYYPLLSCYGYNIIENQESLGGSYWEGDLRVHTEQTYSNGYKQIADFVPEDQEWTLTDENGNPTIAYTLEENIIKYDTDFGKYPPKCKLTINSSKYSISFFWTGGKHCFLKGTLITLADGSKKPVEEITYDDKLKVWNFDKGCYDSAKILWLTKPGLKSDHYIKCTFSDGTVLITTGQNSHHYIYNYTDRKFEGIKNIEIGKEVFTEKGVVTLVSKEWVDEEIEYYSVYTEKHINCFANDVLVSARYNNVYPIDENMKFIKDGRKKRPYSEFKEAGISREWYNGFRLGEQTDSLSSMIKFVDRLEPQMLEKPAPSLWQRFRTWFKSVFGCNS